jgi:hypothetical protein
VLSLVSVDATEPANLYERPFSLTHRPRLQGCPRARGSSTGWHTSLPHALNKGLRGTMRGRPHQLGHQRFQAVRRAVFAAGSLPAPAAVPVPSVSRLEGRGCQGAGLQCWQGRALRGCASGRSPGGQRDGELAAGGLDSHVHVPPRVLCILLLPTGMVVTKAAKYFARCKVKIALGANHGC